jgi:deoxyribodipyrimidine photolyase
METVEIKLYSVEDIRKNEKFKEKVCEKYRYWNVEYMGWWDYVYERIEDEGKERGFDNFKVESFDLYPREIEITTDFNIKKLIENSKKLSKEQKDMVNKLLEEELIDVDGDGSDEFAWYWNVYDDYNEETRDATEEEKGATEILEDEVNEQLQDFIRESMDKLEEEYDGLTSDEYILDTLEANECKFLATGERYFEGMYDLEGGE